MAELLVIKTLPFDLPPHRYKGRSREELHKTALQKLKEANAFWQEALGDMLPLLTRRPVLLELSIDIRNMQITIHHIGVHDPLLIDAFDLFRLMRIDAFRVLWEKIRSGLLYYPETVNI